jgi:predicted porin
MKKHLLAVAVASAVAAPAMAQNVSMYGVFGMGYLSTNNSIGAADTTNLGNSGAAVSTNVFGLKVAEDLGGGLKLGLNFEGNLGDNGQLGNNASGSDGAVFNRLANIQVTKSGLGSLTVGRVGDLIDSHEGYANFVQLFDTEAADEQGLGNKNQETVRYDSEKLFGGLTIGIAESRDARQPTTSTTTLTDQKTFSYAATWSQGPLTVGYASGSAGKQGGGTSSADAQIDTMYVGYNIMGADVRVQQTKEQAETSGLNIKVTEVGVKYGLGNGLTVVGHYEKGNVSNDDDSDYKQWGVMLTKDLSKRTLVYVGFRERDLSGAAASNTDVSVTAFGIQHKF